MLKSIALENFKCFQDKQEFPLSQITIMYGRNGRGKSTVAQSLLLLSQTMLSNNDISNLQLSGSCISLGTFNDVVNQNGENNHFGIILNNDEENVVMYFEKYPEKPQLSKISILTINGETRFDEVAEMGSTSEAATKCISTTSDIESLQMLKSIKYVAASRIGPKNSVSRKDSLDDDNIGVNGENVINVLARKGIDFIDDVEKELSNILGGASIRVNNKDSERIELYLNSKDESKTFRPVNVGFGYSYVLPIIVSALLSQEGSLLIIENPEAHLHPGAQSRIMEFLIKVVKEKKLQILIETHSDHVVNGMRIAIKQGKLNPQDAHILYFSEESSSAQKITCDRNGTLSDYPDDFLDEWTLQLLKLV